MIVIRLLRLLDLEYFLLKGVQNNGVEPSDS